MANEYIGSGSPDGAVLGRSSGKIGFYGLTTPIVKPTVTLITTSTTTVASVIATDLVLLKAALVTLGLIA